jgi:hypothetical protein
LPEAGGSLELARRGALLVLDARGAMSAALNYAWRLAATGFCFAAFSAGGLALTLFFFPVLPLLLIVAVIWLITLPFRLLFWVLFGAIGLVFSLVFGALRLVFSIIGGVLGLLFAPVVLVLGIVGLGIAMLVWLVSALAPLVPLILVGLLVWGVYRLVAQRPSPTF